MSAYRRFRNVQRIGPVTVATFYDTRGRERHTAACTAPRCDFS
ncbi:mobile element transfer protein, partial [Streptomyces sp. SID1034]